MNIERRQKYSNQGRTAVFSEQKIDLNFDLPSLNLMCSYVLSENRNIRRSHFINMRNLFEMINLDIYKNDIEKMKRINFIRKGLEARIIENLNNPVIVMKYINGGILDDDIMDVNNFSLISDSELEWINGTITTSLDYAFVYNDIDRMIDVCTRFKTSDYRSKSAIVEEYKNLVNESQTKFRRNRVDPLTQMTFTLRAGAFEETIRDIHAQITSPSRKLRCGMQGVNEMLNGGFEAGRCYMLLGLTGVGKSLSLLNIAYQMKKANKLFKPKDPTKIPAIVILTMENDVTETVERLFNLTVSDIEMKNYTADEVIQLLRTQGELYLTDESPIDIIIKYVPDKSVDTGYLYTLTEDLEDEGYEVICLIQDHIKRIRSCYPQNDIRIELGAIVNEFKTFASIKRIPVITNSHLNRDGAKTVDASVKGGTADLTRFLGRANIGESMLMLDNLDCGFIINVEYDIDGNKYMVFSRIKARFKTSDRNYICQPFVNGNGIKLVEDIDSPMPVFRETLKSNPMPNIGGNKNIKPSQYTNISVLEDNMIEESGDEDDNIYEVATRYSSNTIISKEAQMDMPMLAGIRSIPSQQPLASAITFLDNIRSIA